MSESILAWHFARNDMKLGYGDDRLIVPGETLSVNCEPVLCYAGLHASIEPMHALEYAPGSMICRVEIFGDVVTGDDKIAGRNRKCLWAYDAESVLWEHARLCALDVIHLWGAPDVVRQYLETGDESLRGASRAAATAAARDAARDAAWDAARDAAWDAARDAARDAAWDAARDAARDAAWGAAWDAARDAAAAGAGAGAGAAAWGAAWDAQNKRLVELLERGHG